MALQRDSVPDIINACISPATAKLDLEHLEALQTRLQEDPTRASAYFKAVNKGLASADPRQEWLAIALLDFSLSHAADSSTAAFSSSFQEAFATDRDLSRALSELVLGSKSTSSSNYSLQDTARLFVQKWALLFHSGPLAHRDSFKQFYDTYTRLKMQGVTFPPPPAALSASSAAHRGSGIFSSTSGSTSSTASSAISVSLFPQIWKQQIPSDLKTPPSAPAQSSGAGGQRAEPATMLGSVARQLSTRSQNESDLSAVEREAIRHETELVKLSEDLQVVREKVTLLADLLEIQRRGGVGDNAVDKETLEDVKDFLDQCKPRIVKLVEAGMNGKLNEELFSQCLEINDNVLRVLSGDFSGLSTAEQEEVIKKAKQTKRDTEDLIGFMETATISKPASGAPKLAPSPAPAPTLNLPPTPAPFYSAISTGLSQPVQSFPTFTSPAPANAAPTFSAPAVPNTSAPVSHNDISMGFQSTSSQSQNPFDDPSLHTNTTPSFTAPSFTAPASSSKSAGFDDFEAFWNSDNKGGNKS